jgi:hypothetical protein
LGPTMCPHGFLHWNKCHTVLQDVTVQAVLVCVREGVMGLCTFLLNFVVNLKLF